MQLVINLFLGRSTRKCIRVPYGFRIWDIGAYFDVPSNLIYLFFVAGLHNYCSIRYFTVVRRCYSTCFISSNHHNQVKEHIRQGTRRSRGVSIAQCGIPLRERGDWADDQETLATNHLLLLSSPPRHVIGQSPPRRWPQRGGAIRG